MKDLNQHLVDGCLRLAIEDVEFLKLIQGRLDPSLFASEVSQVVAETCLDFFNQFKQAPGHHFTDELMRRIGGQAEEKRQLYAAYVEKLHNMHPPTRDYVLRRVNDFVGYRCRERAIEAAAGALQEGNVAEHDRLLREALGSGIERENKGLDYLRDTTRIYEKEYTPPLFGTGMPALDRLIGGYRRKQLIMCLGGYKAGKTWWLLWTALQAIKAGLNVAYLSFEVDEEEIEERLDQMLVRGCTEKARIGKLYEYEIEDVNGIHRIEKRIHHWVYDHPDRVARSRRALLKRGANWFIRKWPSGQCTPAMAESYLAYLEAYENFTPDLVCLDYIDIMDLTGFNSKEVRHQLDSGYKWAKGLADDRCCVSATVSQVTTKALEARYVRMKDVAEDRRKFGHVDLGLAIGKGPEEEKNGIAGINVLANRRGRQNCECIVSQNYAAGQFCLGSWIGEDTMKQAQQAAAAAGGVP